MAKKCVPIVLWEKFQKIWKFYKINFPVTLSIKIIKLPPTKVQQIIDRQIQLLNATDFLQSSEKKLFW